MKRLTAGLIAAMVACTSVAALAADGLVVQMYPDRSVVLPLVVSIALFLIGDIDTPRTGVIRVLPPKLLRRSQSLRGSSCAN